MKPNKDNMDRDQKAAELAASYVAQAMLYAMSETGANLQAVLAGASAQVASEMAASLGGRMAALRLEGAADMVRNLPSASAYSLAFTPPEGSA
jgi:hypothetical protein